MSKLMTQSQNKDAFENGLDGQPASDIYECECQDKKAYRLTFDGASTGQYIMEYCQKCYDSDNKLFMISMEAIQ